MSASIRVDSPQGTPLTFWIEKDVIRIGGHMDCDLFLDGLPQNFATVQFRDGQYVIWNRGERGMKLGRRMILSNTVSAWTPRKVLQLGPYQLTLQVRGNPEPERRPVDVQKREEQSNSKRKKLRRSPSLFQIIGSIFLMMIFCLFVFGEKKTPGTELENVINVLVEDGTQTSINVRTSLQLARVAEMRSNPSAAQQLYQEAAQAIIRAELADEVEFVVEKYVIRRLNQLSSRSSQ